MRKDSSLCGAENAMSSILSTLLLSSGALRAFDQALAVTQNNVANASTPGYAAQTQDLTALQFDPETGATGGVIAGDVVSARNQYAEQAVQQQTTLLGEVNQNVNSLTAVQTNFDITGNSGLTYALNNLFQAFSAWGQTPNDANARQNVINQAGSVAQAFHDTAAGLTTVAGNANQQIQQTVGQVNQVVGQIRQLNQQILNGDRNDAGLDAEMYSDLEQLSNYVPITATRQADGSMTILLNGRDDLLVGAEQYPISSSLEQDPNSPYANGPPLAHIQSAQGIDITATVTSGQLGALLHVRNSILPSYTGSGSQVGDLNTMAKHFADTVNQLLESGTQADGATPGIPLFTYASQGGAAGNADDTSAALTIAVNSAITPDQLAANLPGPPVQSNGVALELAQLANPQNSAEQINGESFTAYYGDMATRVGNALNAATNQQQVSQTAVAQAQNLRQQMSGVDLNAEAMKAVEFERAYEANARLVSVLDQITQDQINILGSTG